MKHEWIYRTTGFLGTNNDLGPILESEFLDLARQGSLSRESLVSSPTRTSGNWFSLSQIPGLLKAVEDGEQARDAERAAMLKRVEDEQRRAKELAEKNRRLEETARVTPRPPPPTSAVRNTTQAASQVKLDVKCPNCHRVLEAGLADTRQTIPCPVCRCPIVLPPAAEVSPFAPQGVVGTPESDARVSIVNGQIQVRCQSPEDAKLAIKELRILKKSLGLQKKQAMEQMRIIRSEYTSLIRGQGSKMRGGGFIGKMVRAAQTVSRDGARAELANRLHPHECQRQYLENLQHQVDSIVLQIQMTFPS